MHFESSSMMAMQGAQTTLSAGRHDVRQWRSSGTGDRNDRRDAAGCA